MKAVQIYMDNRLSNLIYAIAFGERPKTSSRPEGGGGGGSAKV